jgi:hypothetical protein
LILARSGFASEPSASKSTVEFQAFKPELRYPTSCRREIQEMPRQADLGRGHAARRPRLGELPIRYYCGVLIEVLRLASLMNRKWRPTNMIHCDFVEEELARG